MTTTNTLPPPTFRPSCASIHAPGGFACASAMRLGDDMTVSPPNRDGFVSIDCRRDGERIVVSIHRDGVPALIAELQRITYGATS